MIGRFARLGSYKELFDIKELASCLAGGALALGAFILEGRPGFPAWLPLALASASVLGNGLPIVLGALRGLRERRMNVDELVSIALVASVLQGEVLSAAVVAFIMTLGALVEEAVSESARRSIQALARMTPEHATRIEDGREEIVPLGQVRPGDRLLVKPGERIPVDAEIVAGITAVDESSITGESIPRERREGDPVLAGTLNHNGVIEIRATQVGADTTLGKVIRLVTEAEAQKPRAARVVDRYARWFTPVVLACAALAWAFSGDAGRAVAVLVAGCPCALLMAAPTATVAAVGRAARAGVLIKGGQYLEEAARVQVMLFDKTGTLTKGEPRVDEVATCETLGRDELLACAAGAEQNCNHPLARAVLKAAHYARVGVRKAERVLAEIGLGVKALVGGSLVEVGSAEMNGGAAALPASLRQCLERIQERGATALVVSLDHEPVGILGVSDTVKPSAAATVERLRGLGLTHLGMLSGDHERAVNRLAADLKLDQTWAGLKPQDKLAVIEEFQKQGLRVAFVGDGVNDAPALARADMGVAMGALGTDVALETADVALTRDDISRLPFLVRLGRRSVAIIRLNIALAVSFNALAILGGGWGLLTPVWASLAHNLGSIVVVLLSASLALFRDREPA
ncbi:heavy metal translocating P-type ATPase [Desulfovibrio aminophilus]|uniref:heavy metal translocating P-type ATPase n=1 Tax=Desulfovibrio aminophilus TaxID=81425 RepID=UPI003391A4DD